MKEAVINTMNTDDNIIRVDVLENEVEARLLEDMLNKNDIPHILRSFHDSALDGIYQLQKGWGYIEAPEKYNNQIRQLLNDLRKGD